MHWDEFIHTVLSARALASYRLSFGASMVAASINLVFGFILAWTLVRYDFPGRKLIDALIDLPFALPTAVSGIALTTVFAQNGWLGQYLALAGIKVAYTWIGVTIALTLIGMPFLVRTVQPALAEVQRELEDAAEILGASRFYVFRRIILPTVLPAMLTGFALAFARGVGEYGSVIFIAGNLPFKTEITPLPDRHPPGGVRLPRRGGLGLRHAEHLLPRAVGHQLSAALGPPPLHGDGALDGGRTLTGHAGGTALPSRS